jgi:hypothetical protein
MKILSHIRDSRYTTFDLPVDGLRVEVGGRQYEIRDRKGEIEIATVNSARGIIAVPVSQSIMRLADRDVDARTLREEKAAREEAGVRDG